MTLALWMISSKTGEGERMDGRKENKGRKGDSREVQI